MKTAAFSFVLAGMFAVGAVLAQNKPGPHELPPGAIQQRSSPCRN